MQPALACPSIGTSPPPWTAALLPLDWLLYPVLGLLLLLAFDGLWLRDVPTRTRSKMAPWLAASTITAVIAVFGFSLATVIAGERWWDIARRWANQVAKLPGIWPCQVDTAYGETGATGDHLYVFGMGLLWLSFFIGIIAAILFDRALRWRHIALAGRSPGIPDAPDDLAAQTITHRPYRRRGFHRRWR
jgi:hypothetical protein